MIPINLNNQTYFFTINHITKPFSSKLVYGISLNGYTYFLSKSIGTNNCEQLDANPPMHKTVINQICTIITEIEREYKDKHRPTLQFINTEIFKILVRLRNPLNQLQLVPIK